MATDALAAPVEGLPSVLLLQILGFLDHGALHAAERTASVFCGLVRSENLWRGVGGRRVVCEPALDAPGEWKKMACLAHRPARDDKQLLGGVRSYSSADRQSETPANTLTYSRCWAEMRELKGTDVLRDASAMLQSAMPRGMTLGERIQYKCGCSTGKSCYWSSSASADKHATEFIDYAIGGACVLSSVQILPYRVFWHPGCPTYAPEKVRFEFYDDESAAVAASSTAVTARPPTSPPFYTSPVYSVQNEMTLQEFVLPLKVAATSSTTLRIVLIGRHQAQTFELPQWMQRAPSDAQPKYYCCISYVNVVGLPVLPVEHPAMDLSLLAKNLTSCRAAMSLTEYMTSCYQEFMELTRRGQ